MRLSPITSASSKPFCFRCAECATHTRADRDPGARADLDGEPFAAYYCGQCAARMTGRRPVTTEEHRAAGNFVDRWAVTHIGRAGLRVLSSPCQGAYTFATPEEAEYQAGNLASANSPARIAEVYGAQAVGTFRASRVECWRMTDGRIGDPRGIYWD